MIASGKPPGVDLRAFVEGADEALDSSEGKKRHREQRRVMRRARGGRSAAAADERAYDRILVSPLITTAIVRVTCAKYY